MSKCHVCYFPLDETEKLYHKRCIKNLWSASRLPDLGLTIWPQGVNRVSELESSTPFIHHIKKGAKPYLEVCDLADADIVLTPLVEHEVGYKFKKQALVEQIAFELKMLKAPSGFYESEGVIIGVQNLRSVVGLETTLKVIFKDGFWDGNVESLNPLIDEFSQHAGIDKTQLFDLAVLSALAGKEFLANKLSSPFLVNLKEGDWDQLDFEILARALHLPPQYFPRLLLRIQKKSSVILKIVEKSFLKPSEKMSFLGSWKEAWAGLKGVAKV